MELNTTLERRQGDESERAFINMGGTQGWNLDKHWKVDFTFDRSQEIARKDSISGEQISDSTTTKGGDDFSAESVAFSRKDDDTEWMSRLEYRDGSADVKWNLFSGHLRKFSNDLAMSLGSALSIRHGIDRSEDNKLDLRYSLVYRPSKGSWMMMNRLDYLYDKRLSTESLSRNRRWVNNFLANYRVDERNQLSLQYGGKYVLDNIDGGHYRIYSELYGLEYRYVLNPGWDLGAHVSALNPWGADLKKSSHGLSVGFSPDRNTWLSLGYNINGFSDDDFSGANYTKKGFYLKMRIKFDQNSLRSLWSDGAGS
jgi:hypothetical protein